MLPPLYVAIAGVSSLPVIVPIAVGRTFLLKGQLRGFPRSNGRCYARRSKRWLVANKRGGTHAPV